ncbi:MAG TPA: glycosyltransferase family 2 protein [Solirubrobacterales bacterium]|jgi:GT2 family glycosyltransferase
MAGTPDVSVVVSTYNRRDRLPNLLEALRRQTLPRDRFEVVIVNNAATDDTAELLAEAERAGDLRLRVVTRTENVGRARGRDDGWRAASGGLIAFTDDDCEPAPGWLERGLELHRANPEAIIQGRTEPIERELAAVTERERPFTRTIRVTGPDPSYPTCNLFFPRVLLERIGGFDLEAFGASQGGEDSDLAWRAIKAGAPVVFDDQALVHHAVNYLGPIGKLKLAQSWDLAAVARHPEMRRALFFRGPFWKHSHYLLARAALALLVPKRLWPLRLWLVLPYLRLLVERGRVEGGGPLLAPYYVAHDLAEMYAVARGAVRYRTPLI